jgi:hypothetical protein
MPVKQKAPPRRTLNAHSLLTSGSSSRGADAPHLNHSNYTQRVSGIADGPGSLPLRQHPINSPACWMP